MRQFSNAFQDALGDENLEIIRKNISDQDALADEETKSQRTVSLMEVE